MNPDGSDLKTAYETILPELFFSGFPSWAKGWSQGPPAIPGR